MPVRIRIGEILRQFESRPGKRDELPCALSQLGRRAHERRIVQIERTMREFCPRYAVFRRLVAQLTEHLVVLLSVAALLLPAAPAVWLLKGAGFAAEVQNAIVGAAASAGWGHADVRIPAVAVAAAYMVFAAATVVSWGFVRRGDVYSVK